jgi:hypothetical protein
VYSCPLFFRDAQSDGRVRVEAVAVIVEDASQCDAALGFVAPAAHDVGGFLHLESNFRTFFGCHLSSSLPTYMTLSMSWPDMAFCFMPGASYYHMDEFSYIIFRGKFVSDIKKNAVGCC